MPRPTKLTPTVQAAIFDAVRNGNTRRIAAQAAGIGETTFYTWLALGGRPKARKLYREFRAAIEAAEADAVRTAVAAIRLAGIKGSWSAYAWWLERREPDEWARRDHVKLEIDEVAIRKVIDVLQRAGVDPETMRRIQGEFARMAEEGD